MRPCPGPLKAKPWQSQLNPEVEGARRMAIQTTEKIWHNGKLIPWNDAQIHIMSHVVNYGSSVFEGIRCYAPGGEPAIFRLREHMQRLVDSAKMYRIEFDYTLDQLCEAAKIGRASCR